MRAHLARNWQVYLAVCIGPVAFLCGCLMIVVDR